MAKEITANRFEWAASIIAPAPGDQILEVGTGTGILAALIAPELRSGHLTAIDRSAAAINKAIKKNQSFISNGKLTLHAKALCEFPFNRSFNKVVAFNVNIFRKPKEKELMLLRSMLLPGGRLFVFYQTPSGIDKNLMASIEAAMTSHGFSILESRIEEKDPVRSFCLIFTPV